MEYGKYQARLRRGECGWGAKWDPSELEATASRFAPHYHSGDRVKVRTTYESGYVHERTGTISTSTGWKPAWLLVFRSNSIGSHDVLGPNDEIVAVWDGRKYVSR
jgi:hypothetical protein